MKQRQHPRRPPRSDRAAASRRGAPPARKGGGLLLYGLHAVEAALRNPRRNIIELTATRAAAERLAGAISARALEPKYVEDTHEIADLLPPDAVHQGVIARVAPLPPVAFGDLAPASPILALDQVTDPHNVGAILRSAAAFGAAAVIAPEHGAPAPSGALAKAATGALEHVPYIQVVNLARALEQAAKAGYWIVGLDGEGEARLEEAVGHEQLILVLGAEGTGLRRLTREHCDVLARLDLPGEIKTLNVSNAAAIALYAASRARG